MSHKKLFIIAHQVGDRNFYPTYQKLIQNQWIPYEELKEEQAKQLKCMIDFAYKNVPYYHRLFNNLNLLPEDIKEMEDLQKLPILTKDIIKLNWEYFKPINLNNVKYYEHVTGGSTGTPFKYRLNKFDRFFSGALLYRGWNYGGYKLGDRIVFLGGSSLNIGPKTYFNDKIHEVVRNLKKLSSYDMADKEMRDYVNTINSFKPKFIRGYASSIYFFSRWIEENNLEIYQPLAVFTTGENLAPNMREKIGRVFGCDVYNNYGLNDGGVSAYECSHHSGLHIDTERSIMEVVNTNGDQLEVGKGEILATSLYNYAMPFIRYNTGDIGHITDEICSCNRGHKLLKKLEGRSVDILVTPEGKNVHGWFFDSIFWKYDTRIKEYQVVQEKIDKIVINIIPEEDFDVEVLKKIEAIIRTKSKSWVIQFKFPSKIERTSAGKYKFIINQV